MYGNGSNDKTTLYHKKLANKSHCCHKVAIAFLVLGILGIIAVGIYIGVVVAKDDQGGKFRSKARNPPDMPNAKAVSSEIGPELSVLPQLLLLVVVLIRTSGIVVVAGAAAAAAAAVVVVKPVRCILGNGGSHILKYLGLYHLRSDKL